MTRNMFMAHPEAVLLAMLGDVRANAVQLILAIRQQDRSASEQRIRSYKAPAVNTSAETYEDLIDLRAVVKCGGDHEPPYTRSLSDSELWNFQQQPLVTGAPVHTQSAERAVKLTTEASTAISGGDRQDGAALNKRAYRRQHPGQVTKKTALEK